MARGARAAHRTLLLLFICRLHPVFFCEVASHPGLHQGVGRARPDRAESSFFRFQPHSPCYCRGQREARIEVARILSAARRKTAAPLSMPLHTNSNVRYEF